MLKHAHFYNRTIRKMIVAFGTLFNDVVLVRYNKTGTEEFERTRVPLSYGSKEKYITRLSSDPTLTKSINVYVPRIAFDLVGINYDSTRKMNTLGKNFAVTQSNAINSQYSPIPYNFEFDMSIFVRNQEDGTQILEQILPFFTPDFTVTADLIPSLGRKYDIPVTLDSVTPQIEYEGDFSTTRLVIWNLTFTMKGWIFPPVNFGTEKLIGRANTNIYVDNRNNVIQKVYVDMNSGNGVYTTGETIRVQRRNTPNKTGTVVYFANNSTGTLVVSEVTDKIDEGDVIVGDYSNATYTVDSVDLQPIKTISLITEVDPITAGPDDDFGFKDTLLEFPDTLE